MTSITESDMKTVYDVYTDGSTKRNGKADSVGAWAYVVTLDGEVVAQNAGSEVGTTNQRMELMAALEALKVAMPIAEGKGLVRIYTDSAYLHNCYTQRWYVNWQDNGWKNTKKQPVANADLWKELVPYFEDWGVDFFKVKGHADNRNDHEKWNNVVDVLAQSTAEERQKQVKNEGSNN